jgi:hypothetical protein
VNTDLISPSSSWTGQGTKVEQARALAEVYAMLANARESPRSEQLATTRMNDACGRLVLAEKAFYRFPRDGQQVTGATVQLARELARCWGNINFGIKELLRDDGRAQSEMLAEAWDIETSTRSYNVFIVPHKRDTKTGPKDLVNMRDIYENNANAGARRLRECLFAVLPVWFIEEATNLCTEVLENGADKGKQGPPLVERKRRLIEAFTEWRVTLAQLERKIDRPEGRWTAGDVAGLRVIWKSLRAGETQPDMEFPREQTHASDVLGAVADPLPAAPAAPAEPHPQPGPQQVDAGYTDNPYDTGPEAEPGHAQERHALLLDHLAALGYDLTGEEVAEHMGELLGFTHASLNDLTPDEVETLLGELNPAMAANDPSSYLDRRLEQVRIATKRRTPMATRGHIATIHDRLRKLDYPTGGEGTAKKIADIATLIGRPISNTADLSAHEANDVITQLNMILEDEQPHQALRAALDARRRQQTSDWPDVVQPGTHTPESETHE